MGEAVVLQSPGSLEGPVEGAGALWLEIVFSGVELQGSPEVGEVRSETDGVSGGGKEPTLL